MNCSLPRPLVCFAIIAGITACSDNSSEPHADRGDSGAGSEASGDTGGSAPADAGSSALARGGAAGAANTGAGFSNDARGGDAGNTAAAGLSDYGGQAGADARADAGASTVHTDGGDAGSAISPGGQAGGEFAGGASAGTAQAGSEPDAAQGGQASSAAGHSGVGGTLGASGTSGSGGTQTVNPREINVWTFTDSLDPWSAEVVEGGADVEISLVHDPAFGAIAGSAQVDVAFNPDGGTQSAMVSVAFDEPRDLRGKRLELQLYPGDLPYWVTVAAVLENGAGQRLEGSVLSLNSLASDAGWQTLRVIPKAPYSAADVSSVGLVIHYSSGGSSPECTAAGSCGAPPCCTREYSRIHLDNVRVVDAA